MLNIQKKPFLYFTLFFLPEIVEFVSQSACSYKSMTHELQIILKRTRRSVLNLLTLQRDSYLTVLFCPTLLFYGSNRMLSRLKTLKP